MKKKAAETMQHDKPRRMSVVLDTETALKLRERAFKLKLPVQKYAAQLITQSLKEG